MTWTRFMDMSSGGSTKEPPYEYIYIEAPEAEAKVIFYNRFGHNPERVTCTCCGEDYSISEEPSLAQASAYDRNEPSYTARPTPPPVLTVEEYQAKPEVLVIPASEISDDERLGDVPEQGYIWAG